MILFKYGVESLRDKLCILWLYFLWSHNFLLPIVITLLNQNLLNKYKYLFVEIEFFDL